MFEKQSFVDFNEWANNDKKIYKKIVDLITEITRQPYQGTGKPEPLKHELQGYWSRRITEEHRLVYKVEQNAILIIACKYHYD